MKARHHPGCKCCDTACHLWVVSTIVWDDTGDPVDGNRVLAHRLSLGGVLVAEAGPGIEDRPVLAVDLTALGLGPGDYDLDVQVGTTRPDLSVRTCSYPAVVHVDEADCRVPHETRACCPVAAIEVLGCPVPPPGGTVGSATVSFTGAPAVTQDIPSLFVFDPVESSPYPTDPAFTITAASAGYDPNPVVVPAVKPPGWSCSRAMVNAAVTLLPDAGHTCDCACGTPDAPTTLHLTGASGVTAVLVEGDGGCPGIWHGVGTYTGPDVYFQDPPHGCVTDGTDRDTLVTFNLTCGWAQDDYGAWHRTWLLRVDYPLCVTFDPPAGLPVEHLVEGSVVTCGRSGVPGMTFVTSDECATTGGAFPAAIVFDSCPECVAAGYTPPGGVGGPFTVTP